MKKSDMRGWIRENASGFDDAAKFAEEAAREFGVPRKTAQDAISYLRRTGVIMVPEGVAPSKAARAEGCSRARRKGSFRMSVDLSEIAGEFDEEAKIVRGLESLGTRLIKDNDFRVELGVPIDRWKVVGGLPKFAANKRELKGKRFRGVYWGGSAVVKELSRKIDILP